MDLSLSQLPRIRVPHLASDATFQPWYTVRNKTDRTRPTRFPPGTRGFLYYHHPPGLPSTAGALRFRLTDSPDPSSISRGTDLLQPETQLPWEVSLARLATTQYWKAAFDHLLLQDRLVTSDDAAPFRRKPLRDPRMLHYIGQPFHVDFSNPTLIFNTVDTDSITHNIITCVFHSLYRGLWYQYITGT